MKLSNQMFTALVLASLASTAAFAEEAPATSTTNAKSLSDSITASFSTAFYGPSVIDPVSSTMPTNNGESRGGAPILMENAIRAAYKFDNGMSLGPAFRFNLNPTQGKGFTLKDPYLRLALGTEIAAGNFSLSGDVRYGAPISPGSQAKDSYFGYLRTTQAADYKLGTSAWSLGLTGILIGHMHGDATYNKDGKAVSENLMDLVFIPAINYQVSPSLAATLAVEQDFNAIAGSGVAAAWTAIQPGVSWDITPAVNLNPYLQLVTSDQKQITAKSTSINFNFSWKFL